VGGGREGSREGAKEEGNFGRLLGQKKKFFRKIGVVFPERKTLFLFLFLFFIFASCFLFFAFYFYFIVQEV